MEKLVKNTCHSGINLIKYVPCMYDSCILDYLRNENHINRNSPISYMKNQVYGAEKGYGRKIVSWLDEQAQSNDLNLEISITGDSLMTQNFGDFDLFFLSNDSIPIRKLIQKAGKRFNVKMIEGGYNEKARIIRRKKSDYAKVLKGDKVIGHLELESSRFGSSKWEIKSEERR